MCRNYYGGRDDKNILYDVLPFQGRNEESGPCRLR